MLNTSYDEKFGKKGLTFDDVLLIPGESDVEPKNVDVSTHLTKTIKLNTPLMTASVNLKLSALINFVISGAFGTTCNK